ncbi:Transcription factor tau 55 kDa subunit [Pichia kudriavzevii]|uniref:Transcription factor tau 55 kDa subunit n=1 Tax=Pichia kudriavzevii TaxID=4909 RepID=A0A1V2LJD6_PICKU|nr:Transcription factor tau 55 kDa subunit [Pichia kudriavzevii]
MTLKTIYIARHGYRSNWLPLPEQIPPPTGIDSDPPLAPHGVKQAQELAGFITKDLPQKNLPVPQMIFSSPFYRCIETINPTAEALHLPIQLERGLGEWFKPHRKIVPVPADHLTLHKFFNTVPSEMDWLWDTVIPSLEGETEEEIFKRCQVFWSKFIPKFESIYPNVECIILVTHAATKIALGMALAGYSNVRDFLTEKDGGDGKTTRIGGSTCSLDGYAKSSNGDTWNLFMNAETSFLSCGAEMDWHFATSQFEAGRNMASNEIQESIDYKNEAGVSTAINKLRVSGWEKETPLVQNKNDILQGEWTRLVGTELIFDENGQYIATVDDHILLQYGRLQEQKLDKSTLLERARNLAKQVEEEKKENLKKETKVDEDRMDESK